MADGQQSAWRLDAALLAQIGEQMSGQSTKITVQLPRPLAEAALAAWRRGDGTGETPAGVPAERDARGRPRRWR